jgi:hypothetical protein
LARDVVLGAQGDITIAVAFDDRRQTRRVSHVPDCSAEDPRTVQRNGFVSIEGPHPEPQATRRSLPTDAIPI